MKKITVSIGIPAYNEEANIQRLVKALTKQTEKGFVIQEIIVIDDGSSDRTHDLLMSIKDKRVKIIKNKDREGQVYCQNLFFELIKSDIAVLVEADIVLGSQRYIEALVSPIIKDPSVGIVYGHARQLRSHTIIGKTLNLQTKVYQLLNTLRKAKITGRGGKALARVIFENLRWPRRVPEDSYLSLWAMKNQVKCVFARNAVTYYKCAQTMFDWLTQCQKIHSGKKALVKFFDSGVIASVYEESVFSIAVVAFIFLIANPLLFSVYLVMKVLSVIKITGGNFTDKWPIAVSTKSIDINLSFVSQSNSQGGI